jgi:glycosyltransferase involved in cell wall biosynthesis
MRADVNPPDTTVAPPSGAPAPARTIASVFRCPGCGQPLKLSEQSEGNACADCGYRLGEVAGVLDFAGSAERAQERAYYESEYGGGAAAGSKAIDDLAAFWHHPAKPVNRALIRQLGDLRGKRVLLVGNGGSPLELHFLTQEPELLIFSDLATAGVAGIREQYDLAEDDRVVFAAIDALELPLADESVDIVYGKAIVHHLPDRPQFLREVARVLRPGGGAVFMDDGYVSAWQLAKRTLLKPLFAYSHWRYPRSPEDVRETLQGGFREEELAVTIRELGAQPRFERLGLTYYLWRRASLVLLPPRLRHVGEHRLIAGPLIRLDELLVRNRLGRRNAFRLIWGLSKPPQSASEPTPTPPRGPRRAAAGGRRRIAFIDYFPIHYRIGLYEEISRRMDADFYFYADEQERWHNKEIAAIWDGDFHRVELPKTRIAGQALMPGIARALSSKRYDAVIKNLNGKLMLPLTYATARGRGVPFVLWTGVWHEPDSAFHRQARRLTRGLYRSADAIVAYGEHVRSFLCEFEGVEPDKVFVAGQAVDPARFEAVTPSRNGNAEVLFIGQFKEYKGIDTLLDAVGRLGDSDVRLRMIGNGPLDDRVQAAAAANPALNVVGHVKQEELPGELARARCLVLPSVTTPLDKEPWGLVVNEAMHAGLPVIASTAVGAAAAGLVRDGRNGYVVPERDPEALASAIQALADDPTRAAALGDQAREDVAAFDYARMADAFEAAVERAVTVRAGR